MNDLNSNIFLDFLLSKKYKFLRHSSVLLFLLVFIFSRHDPEKNTLVNSYVSYFVLLFAYLCIVVMLYVNMYILVPKFLYNKRYVTYSLIVILLVFTGLIFILVFGEFFEKKTPTKQNIQLSGAIEIGISLIPFILSSTTIKLFQRWVKDSSRISELENQALNSELKALKNQINPHFLFNMLNNLNVLIKKDQEKASYITLKLSDFLRHHLYENSDTYVSLSSEIQFLEDFLNLEKIRRDDFTFNISCCNRLDTELKIPTNVFSVFVENAVKHSLDSDKPSKIDISFKAEESTLIFECINTKPEFPYKESDSSGIGLKNVKQRLELLYDDKFSLSIIDEDKTYKLNLKLPL
ncbi:sensor histidine kinase [Winogradskyella poriferorum]|uniref:Histidine kinase n=1 Tax=Winogradskyella poriferorum TaxID=307627 RepID=A0ABU7W4N0_9FLAO